jgi:hypothetical protein
VLPAAYRTLAEWVAAHRVYVFGVGLGGLIPLFTFGVLAGLFPWGSHTAARVVVLGGAWLIVLHWPLIIAYFWFNPKRDLPAVVAWAGALSLSVYIVVTLVGPPLVWLLPPASG